MSVVRHRHRAGRRPGRALVAALERTDWLDRALVLAALAFFLAVVLFVLKERLLDRGLRLAFWWTRLLPAAAPPAADAKAALSALSVSSGSPAGAAASRAKTSVMRPYSGWRGSRASTETTRRSPPGTTLA